MRARRAGSRPGVAPRVAIGSAALALAALALCGCETTAETSARLEKRAKQQAPRALAVQTGVSITRDSTRLKVLDARVLTRAERTAVVVTLRNDSPLALRAAPIALDVKDARGASLYSNTAPGLTPALTSVPFVPAHAELSWIDDQVTGAARASGVSARVGEGSPARGPVPRLRIAGAHAIEDPANGPSEEGILVNESPAAQRELVIFAVARQAGKLKAAGRAVLPEAPARTSTRFQIVFVGDPRGARLQLSVSPTTFG